MPLKNGFEVLEPIHQTERGRGYRFVRPSELAPAGTASESWNRASGCHLQNILVPFDGSAPAARMR
jgi:hypothetical protein